jgi:hypothetical protein
MHCDALALTTYAGRKAEIGNNHMHKSLLGAAVCFFALFVSFMGTSCQHARRVTVSDVVGTWVSDDPSTCEFTFRTDGSATFKNVPTVLFDSADEATRRLQAGTFWGPPYSSRSGHWTITQPELVGISGIVRFQYPNGNGFDIDMTEDNGRLVLFFFVGDPDASRTVGFHRR